MLKWVWSFSGCLQHVDNLAHIPGYSLGSNYSKTVKLPSPK